MFIDAQQMFSDKQTVSATGYSTDTIEIPTGLGAGLDMAVQVIVRSESGTNPTLTVELETSSDNSTFVKLVGTTKPAGEKMLFIGLDKIAGLRKYLRLRYVVGGTTPSFSITSMLVEGGGFSSKGVQHLAARSQD